ncbi:AMP-binding protein [Allobacillus sp. GCM10007489]|uniref:AMP-binding protein n=1 Tax=unclassified Allobacillus TaxID=2628859 RepID=UPI0021051AD0|nr:AMP-binding protein [Allobacillus sp. SKP2-8]
MTKAVWNPSSDYVKNTRLYQFMQRFNHENYDEFFQESIQDIGRFWGEVDLELNLQWFEPYQSVLNLENGNKYPKWFDGGKMNVAYNALDRFANDVETQNNQAIIWEGDNGEVITYTYKDLQDQVNQVANGLVAQGAKSGDRFTIFMPMIPETVIAMLAVSKIGAIFCPAFSGYKSEAIATRINGAQARYLITADGFYRGGKQINLKEEADQAVADSSSIEKVFVVRRTNEEVSWNADKDVDWEQLKTLDTHFESVHTNGDDPYMIIFTSGTTGKPKGTLHTHHGFPVKAAFDAGVMMDVTEQDNIFWYTDMGWMMGPFLVYGGLMNGATITVFEGTPTYPEPSRIWELVEKHQVTHLGISPTLIRTLMTMDESYATKHDLSTLKMVGSTGEPWNDEPWMWLFEKVLNRKVPIINYSGGTEISGGILTNVLVKPIAPVAFNAAVPGMDVDIYDENGQSVKNEVGELVIKQPWVGMTKGFYQDNERYEKTYWNRYPDTWCHGDWVICDEEGFYTITGRSDDTLNVAGKRIGPAELESIYVEHEAVVEAGVIGVPHEVKGESPIAFVVIKENRKPESELIEELTSHAIHRLGKAIAPREVYIVEDLPKTRNAKVMRRAIRTAYLGEDAGDLSALENPESVDYIKRLNTVK